MCMLIGFREMHRALGSKRSWSQNAASRKHWLNGLLKGGLLPELALEAWLLVVT